MTIQQNINILNTEWTSIVGLWDHFPEQTAHTIKDLCKHKATREFTMLIESFNASKSFLMKSTKKRKINKLSWVQFLKYWCLFFFFFLASLPEPESPLVLIWVIDDGLGIGHKDTAADVLQPAGTAIVLPTSTAFRCLWVKV